MNSNSQIWTSGPRLDFGRYIAVSGTVSGTSVHRDDDMAM
jgi:hypothetical protein